MPTRSLGSSVLVWPDAEQVRSAVDRWANELAASDSNVLRIGYYGSYARGDWGVGSDLDLVIVVKRAHPERFMRGVEYPVEQLPVPADVVVYTPAELAAVLGSNLRFGGVLRDEVVWVLGDAGDRG